MIIKSLELNNFRIYKGVNRIEKRIENRKEMFNKHIEEIKKAIMNMNKK